MGFPRGSMAKNLPANAGGADSVWVGKIPGEGTHSIILPGKSHGQRSLVDYNLWGHKSVRHDLATSINNKRSHKRVRQDFATIHNNKVKSSPDLKLVFRAC